MFKEEARSILYVAIESGDSEAERNSREFINRFEARTGQKTFSDLLDENRVKPEI